MSEEKQYRVIAKAIVNVACRPVTAASPQQAIEKVVDDVDWNRLFLNAHQARSFGIPITEIPIAWTDFGDDFEMFVVDPVGDDGEVDVEHSVWLKPDGTPWQPNRATTTIAALILEDLDCGGHPPGVYRVTHDTGVDPVTAIKAAAREFAATPEGQTYLSDEVGGDAFNWGDAVVALPPDVLARHGIQAFEAEELGNRVLVVDHDEGLIPRGGPRCRT
jgi:hypothetical protein